jgi:hypothetical protein
VEGIDEDDCSFNGFFDVVFENSVVLNISSFDKLFTGTLFGT